MTILTLIGLIMIVLAFLSCIPIANASQFYPAERHLIIAAIVAATGFVLAMSGAVVDWPRP